VSRIVAHGGDLAVATLDSPELDPRMRSTSARGSDRGPIHCRAWRSIRGHDRLMSERRCCGRLIPEARARTVQASIAQPKSRSRQHAGTSCSEKLELNESASAI